MKKLILCGVSAVLFVIDLWSKYAASTLTERVQVIPNFFYLAFIRNTGSAWSMFEGMGPVVIVVGVIVGGVMAYYFYKSDNLLLLIGLALGFAGNLGNLYDRIVFGYVRDMLSFNIFGYWFPIFNVADVCMVIGVGVVFLYTILEDRKKEKL